MRIDSHHHFWNYNPQQYPWIDDAKAVLRRDFQPVDLQAELSGADISGPGIDGVVSVQARQTVDETRWLLQLADQHEFIRGVVGWVPLASEQIEQVLAEFADSKWLKSRSACGSGRTG